MKVEHEHLKYVGFQYRLMKSEDTTKPPIARNTYNTNDDESDGFIKIERKPVDFHQFRHLLDKLMPFMDLPPQAVPICASYLRRTPLKWAESIKNKMRQRRQGKIKLICRLPATMMCAATWVTKPEAQFGRNPCR